MGPRMFKHTLLFLGGTDYRLECRKPQQKSNLRKNCMVKYLNYISTILTFYIIQMARLAEHMNSLYVKLFFI